MRRKYPKAENIKFLICEHARPELNKKISILGWYSGDHIVFYPEVKGKYPYFLAALSFVFILKDGVGEFDADFEMLDPKGNATLTASLAPMSLTTGGAGGIMVNMQNVQFNAEGNYIALLRLGKKRYEFPFLISSASAPGPQ